MGETFANNSEIASKGEKGQTIAAFPDPCFTPPMTPAGEVVIPYPNTAKISDLDKGTTKVLIKGKMAAMAGTSYMKTSLGDDAANGSLKGVVTHKIKGKAYFTKGSANVKVEGKDTARHSDLTTNNHASKPGNAPPWPYLDTASPAKGGDCQAEIEKANDDCKGTEATQDDKGNYQTGGGICKGVDLLPTGGDKGNADSILNEFSTWKIIDVRKQKKFTYGWGDNPSPSSKAAGAMSAAVEGNPCLRALRCSLTSYKNSKNRKGSDQKPKCKGCCPGQSGHHVVPCEYAEFKCFEYDRTGTACNQAPVICVEGVNNTHGTHGKIHSALENRIATLRKNKREKGENEGLTCKEILKACQESVHEVFSNCSEGCIAAQLSNYGQINDEKCAGCQDKKKSISPWDKADNPVSIKRIA